MKINRQKPPYAPYRSALEIKIWKKRAYPAGWHAWLQVGQRAWRFTPSPKPRDESIRYSKQAQGERS